MEVNVTLSSLRCTSNPVSFVELSVQVKLIWVDETAVATNADGGLGEVHGVGVGVAVGTGVGVGVPPNVSGCGYVYVV